MKKRFLAILCAVCICTLNIPATVSALYVGSLLKCDYITSEKAGNIFSDTDDIIFTQNVENKTTNEVTSKYSWYITDEAGNSIASYSWNETFTSRESKTRTITIDNPAKFGIYTITVNEENYATSQPNSKYYDSYSEEFSVCISIDQSSIDPDFGFNQIMVNDNRPECCDYTVAFPLMRKAGAKWHRESVMWAGVEPKTKGTYIDLTPYKNRLAEINASGINTVCVLTGRNSLYDNNNCPSSPEAIAAYASFCAYVADGLKGVVDHFEICNEWNSSNFNPSGESPETYAEVLKAAYTAIKAVDPDIIVIGCATAGITTQANTWTRRVLAALNGGTYMDALSVHCYDYSDVDAFPESQFVSEAQQLKSVMEYFNIDVPVWLTEVGFSTYDNSTNGFVPGCSKDVQLNSMVMLSAINKANGLFDKVLQYNFYDLGDYTQIESNWGFLNCWKRGFTNKPESELLPSGAKPAYLGTAAMNYFIGGNTEFLNMSNDGRKYAFEFYNFNLDKNVILAINGGFDNTVTRDFELDYPTIDIYDKYGNLIDQMSSRTGTYSIETYSEPIYIIEGDEENEESYQDMNLNVSIDINTLEVTITGKTEEPEDLVSVMVVTKGEELSAYDPARIQYIEQTTSDSRGNFTVRYTANTSAGTYQIYANSKSRKSRVVNDLEFVYTVPKITVTKDNETITDMSALSAGDKATIKFTGLEATAEQKATILVGQYKNGILESFKMLDATGSFTVLGNEFSGDFTVSDDADQIKIMYWYMDNIVPVVAVYDID